MTMSTTTPPPSRPPVLVLGLGNPLLRDEGVGVHVAAALAEAGLPPSVEVVDGGTLGLDLADVIGGRRLVVVVDACAGPWAPGTVLRLGPDELQDSAGAEISAHGPALPEALRLARFLGDPPDEVVVLAVVPADTGWGEELTPRIGRLVPEILSLVHTEIERAAA
jgi:hydrogenase maturation protease